METIYFFVSMSVFVEGFAFYSLTTEFFFTEALSPSTTLPCSVNDTKRLSWSPTRMITSSHTHNRMMTRTKIPIQETKPPPTPTKTFCRSAVTWMYEWPGASGLGKQFWKSRPGPCYGNSFTWGMGSGNKREGENTGIPLRSWSPAVVQAERRDKAASADISLPSGPIAENI